jgi:hypothetical protein
MTAPPTPASFLVTRRGQLTSNKGEPMPAPEAQQIVTDIDRQLLAVPDNA